MYATNNIIKFRTFSSHQKRTTYPLVITLLSSKITHSPHLTIISKHNAIFCLYKVSYSGLIFKWVEPYNMGSCIMSSFSLTLSKFIWYYSMYQNFIPFGFHWWSSGADSVFPLQEAKVQPLLGKLWRHMPWGMAKKKNFPPFYGWTTFYCLYIPHIANSFIPWWIFGSFSCSGYYD